MSSSKFMVFKLKEVIKTALFAVLGLIIIVGIICFFTGGKDNETAYVPGVYSCPVGLQDELAIVEVTVTKNRIQSVDLIHTAQNVPVFYPLLDSVAESVGDQIVQKQSAQITLPEESPVTASLITEAVEKCLQDAQQFQ